MSGFTFRTLGDPISQGSKTPIKNHRGQVVGMRESSATKLRPWRKALAEDARRAHHAAGYDRPLDGPLELWVTFRLKRPADARFKIWQAKKPDGDKLLRAVMDSLKAGGTIIDDGRVARFHVEKLLATPHDPWTGAHVHLVPIEVDDYRQAATVETGTLL